MTDMTMTTDAPETTREINAGADDHGVTLTSISIDSATGSVHRVHHWGEPMRTFSPGNLAAAKDYARRVIAEGPHDGLLVDEPMLPDGWDWGDLGPDR